MVSKKRLRELTEGTFCVFEETLGTALSTIEYHLYITCEDLGRFEIF